MPFGGCHGRARERVPGQGLGWASLSLVGQKSVVQVVLDTFSSPHPSSSYIILNSHTATSFLKIFLFLATSAVIPGCYQNMFFCFCFLTWADSSGIRYELLCVSEGRYGVLGCGLYSGETLTVSSFLSTSSCVLPVLNGMFWEPKGVPFPLSDPGGVGRSRTPPSLWKELAMGRMCWVGHSKPCSECSIVWDYILQRRTHTGEQRSGPHVSGSSWRDIQRAVFVYLYVGNAVFLLSRESCHAKSFCNFLNEKLLGKNKLSYNIFQMHLHWLWGKDGRKRITVMVSSTKSKTEKLWVWCDNIQRLI